MDHVEKSRSGLVKVTTRINVFESIDVYELIMSIVDHKACTLPGAARARCQRITRALSLPAQAPRAGWRRSFLAVLAEGARLDADRVSQVPLAPAQEPG
eukprot:CAMPEP_0181205668 /NCGR_PEP_ID=MMETSP1096-20121128/20604_1 /TAXON_ID=156174 ORGANISM="Chrysochromulina ericina, Strain CCMP281" /NCGR_SAMPLE_ID=MMETSP1096 /ASSEMBLY_ACC=CAM_ASM_000453 /LENGTH=98 /DNA_ID=CAMNT_0023296475 /DNA_START=92 /DNA_END=389 /DNA_ORIENTATION=+